MTFQRARTQEQRAFRREAILATTEQMLAEMPAAQVSLNELSRRVGLAKSNVLRYFDSREAILLELLDAHFADWVAGFSETVAAGEKSKQELRARVAHVAEAMASTLATRPVLCDLLYAESGVLERNVSAEVVLRHKHATQLLTGEVEHVLTSAIPELNGQDVSDVVIALLLVAAAAWPYAQPGEALRAAYKLDESVQAMHRDFTTIVQRTLILTIHGLITEREGG